MFSINSLPLCNLLHSLWVCLVIIYKGILTFQRPNIEWSENQVGKHYKIIQPAHKGEIEGKTGLEKFIRK